MPATLYPITARFKIFEQFFAMPGDFTRGPAESAPARRLLDEPGWTVYCIDPDAREIVFVRTPETCHLPGSAFYMISQYREANAVIALPFAEAHELAASLPDPKLILVFGMGRAGTTLMNHALNGAESVVSLSEPGAFEHRPLRALAEKQDISELLRDLTRLSFAPHGAAGVDTLAIKFRSQALFISEHFWRALPEAHLIFMYRDAIGWGNSFLQFTADVGIKLPMDEQGRAKHWMMISGDMPLAVLGRYVDLDELPANSARMFAPAWTIHMAEYMRLYRLGLPFLALRYNEFAGNSRAELERLFAFCGLPISGVEGALKAFDEDSQKGTPIARKADKLKFTPDELVTFRETLAREPALADPDLILKDIYRG
jgi:hypothetical protein